MAHNTQAGALRWLQSATPGDYQPLLHAIGTCRGVIVEHAACNNGQGIGYLKLIADAGGVRAAWKAPGSAAFGTSRKVLTAASEILTDGADSNKWLQIIGNASYLQNVGLIAPVYLRVRANVMGDDAEPGNVDEGVAYLQNIHTQTVYQVKAWSPFSIHAIRKQAPDSWVKPTTEAAGLVVAESLAPDAVTSFQWQLDNTGYLANYNQQGRINVSWQGQS
jgi:hypothetical protein